MAVGCHRGGPAEPGEGQPERVQGCSGLVSLLVFSMPSILPTLPRSFLYGSFARHLPTLEGPNSPLQVEAPEISTTPTLRPGLGCRGLLGAGGFGPWGFWTCAGAWSLEWVGLVTAGRGCASSESARVRPSPFVLSMWCPAREWQSLELGMRIPWACLLHKPRIEHVKGVTQAACGSNHSAVVAGDRYLPSRAGGWAGGRVGRWACEETVYLKL